MALALEEVTQQALLLPTEEKALLIDRLLETFDQEKLGRWDEAWLDEAEKRYRELKGGKIIGIPAEEVFAGIRTELRCKS